MGVAAFETVAVARQAVFGVLACEGHAQVAAAANPGQAHAAGTRAVEAAGHAAPLGPAAAHAVVVGVPTGGLHVHGQVARAAGQRDSAGLFAHCAAGAQLGAAFVALVGHGRGHLAVQHVDHAAHGAAAVDQCRRPAQHFDLCRQQRLGRHGVVRADGGGVVQFGPVREHAHARAVHAANHVAAGARAEMAAGDAGLAVQGLAQRGLALAHEGVALQHRHGLCHFGHAQLQTAGGHGDLGQAGIRLRPRGCCAGQAQQRGPGQRVHCARHVGERGEGVHTTISVKSRQARANARAARGRA